MDEEILIPTHDIHIDDKTDWTSYRYKSRTDNDI